PDPVWDVRWEGAQVVITAPAEPGWTARLDFAARLTDGSEARWSVDAGAASVVVPTVPPDAGVRAGATALLIVHLSAFDPKGQPAEVISLGGRVVEERGGGWVASATEWEGVLAAAPPVDPHAELVLDSEGAR
ncbi:MAG: hypothetical protein ABMA64_42785, partial [Myxococcota bacterium]